MEANEVNRKHSQNEGEVIQANEDMISQLPEPIQLHILSFMPIKDAGRTSVLSKSWQKVWKSLPVVDLIKFPFPPKKLCFEELEDSFTNFHESLSNLCKHKAIVQCFDICLPSSAYNVTARLDGCIDLVMRNCVKALSIQIRSSLFGSMYEPRTMYTLPQFVFATRSLTSLKLSECKLGNELFVSITEFPHMRVLCLEDVCVEEENLQKLLSLCPLLEEFTLTYNPVIWFNPFKPFLMKVHLFNLSRLQKVKLIYIANIKFDLPILETLEIFAGFPTELEITNFGNLKEFTLHDPMILKPRLEELVSKCHQLETLNLSISDTPCFKISSQSLKTLNLYDLSKVERIVINAPNLHSYMYTVHGMSIALHSINSTSLKEFMVELRLTELDFGYLNFLSNSLAIFSQQQVDVGLTISWDVLLPMQLEKCPVPPMSCINSLKLIYRRSSDDFTLLVNKLLLICRPIKLQVICLDKRCEQSLKVFCEKLIQRDENPKGCGNHCTFTCWQPYLKGANLVVMAEDLESDGENVFSPLPSQSMTEFRLEWGGAERGL